MIRFADHPRGWSIAVLLTAACLVGSVLADSEAPADPASGTPPLRYIAEEHIKEDCGGIVPSVSDWLSRIPAESWMSRGYPAAPAA